MDVKFKNIASPLTITQASDAVNVAIQKYWLKGNEEKTEYFRKFYNVTTGVTDQLTKDSGLSGLKSASRTIESASIVSQSPVQLFDQTLTLSGSL